MNLILFLINQCYITKISVLITKIINTSILNTLYFREIIIYLRDIQGDSNIMSLI